MRFAITATDRYLGIFETLVNNGWTPVKLFTSPVDNRLFFNAATIKYAQRLGVAVQLSPICTENFEELEALGCDILVVASYNQRIENWTPYLKYAVNFHPSPLPVGRGPYPIVQAIRERHLVWGVTCHKLSPRFDAGDILASERISVSSEECHDSLDLKIQMASKRLAANVALRFIEMWHNSQPQVGGSYWKIWDESEQTIKFDEPVDQILLQLRSFCGHGTFVCLNGYKLRVRRALGWTEPHFNIPGTVVHVYNTTIVVATINGYIALIEWSPESMPAELSKSFAIPILPVQQNSYSDKTIISPRNMRMASSLSFNL